jgi:hypothetical protein
MNDSVVLNGEFANLIKVKMKRVLMLAIVLALVMIPAASFAKAVISDNELEAVTAEAGVSITFSNLSISSLTFSTLSIGDPNGINAVGDVIETGYTGAGWFGAAGAKIAAGGSNTIDLIGAMNVDVGTSGTQTRVKIDLPSITIGGSAGMNITGTLVLARDKTLTSTAGTLGTVDIQRFKTYVSGTVTVFAH